MSVSRYKTYAWQNLILSAALNRDNYPMKQTVISPSMLYLLYPLNEDLDGYSRAQFTEDLINECVKDIRGCFQSGARRVSIDFTEGRLACKNDARVPWTCTRLLETFIGFNNRVLSHFSPTERVNIGIHSCSGADCDSSHSCEVPYTSLLPSLFRLNAGYFLMDISSEPNKESIYRQIGGLIRRDANGVKQVSFIGVTNTRNPRVETAEEICEAILEASKYISVDQLGATDDYGQLFLIFVPPQLSFPIDGLRYQDQEQRYVMPIGNGREMEIAEVKFGFIPQVDPVASRIRRRYRLTKGGHSQLILLYYTRGQSTAIAPSLNQPLRAYPLRTPNEPAVYVIGEKMGQKVYPNQGGPPSGPPMERQPSMPSGAMGQMGMSYGMGGNPAALLAQQNQNIEAMERRQRERSGSTNQRGAAPRVEPDDSEEESESISTRTLALTRYRRNHEIMNEVFMYAAFGNLQEAPETKPAYGGFKREDLDTSIAKLNAEIEELQAAANARREGRTKHTRLDEDLADTSMDTSSPEPVLV
ncbi:hypothetical protein EUX98_g4812 [Antrodiella citrinella]|uniref:SWI/SNF and RSC complexes subunit Ssr4 N-terminal domain-containing protein n=1 Tax=Antrodiella citrinella TaxID=2447956 RepID=A0A4S4MT76_9APHY|nr:hypothetical protein EUX98_g4812 [Antrodiella citrinella]